jgi:PKD repeat protein
MKLSNYYKYLIICIIFNINILCINAQTNLCNDNDCGDVFATYSPIGSNVFCEGATVILQNRSSTKDFEVFYIDWGDGKKDTVRNYDDIKHVYTYSSPFKRCESNAKFNQIISYIGEKKCGTKKSCNTATTVVSVKLNPEANMDIQSEYCLGKTINFKENGCHGETFLWEFGDGKTSTDRNPTHSYSNTGFYSVTLTAYNECGFNKTTKSIRVVDLPKAGFTVNPEKGLCGPGVIQLKMNEDLWGKGSWGIVPIDTSSWKFLDTTYTMSSKDLKISARKPGDFTITHTSQNVCGIDKSIMQYKVFIPPTYQIDTPNVFCEKAEITEKDLKFTASGDIKSISWTFEGANRSVDSSERFNALTFTKSGTVTMKIASEVCSALTHEIPITVIQNPKINLSENPNTFCAGGDTLILKASPLGGRWKGQGIIDPIKGTFYPKDLPENTSISLTYQIGNGGCSASDSLKIAIIATPAISLLVDSFCVGDSPKLLLGQPNGGIYSGIGVDPISGLFSPVLSGAGRFNVSYTLDKVNGCRIIARDIILVDKPPVLTLADSLLFCNSDQVSNLLVETNLKVDSTNGQFTWAGKGVISTEGSLNTSLLPQNEISTLFVQYERYGCSVKDSIFIKSINIPILTLSKDTTLCIDAMSFQLTSNISGGTWTGKGVEPQKGLVDLSVPTSGKHIYRYTFRPETSCFQEGNVTIDLLNPGLTISAGARVEICPDAPPFLLSGGFPDGGTWTGPGLSGTNDALVQTSLLLPGENKFIYCISDPNFQACKACATKVIFLNTAPTADFTLPNNICLNTTFSPQNKSVEGNEFLWTTEENQSSDKKSPSFLFKEPGLKNLKLEVKNDKNCQTSKVSTFNVSTPANISISLSDDESCAPYTVSINKISSGDNLSITWINGKDTILSADPPTWKLKGTGKDTTYKIEAIAKNSCAEIKDVKEIIIHPLPKAIFGTFPLEGCSPLSVKMANLSEGGPLQYIWDYGNGNKSFDSLAIEQLYYLDGTDYKEYKVTLRTENACGKDSLEKIISVYKRDTEAFFEIESLNGCPPFQLTAKNFSSSGATLNWQLTPPDGKIISGNQNTFNPILTASGEYNLLLGATKCGTDTFQTKINVWPAPIITPVNKDNYCLNEIINSTFSVNDLSNVSNILWQHGDGTSSNNINAPHTYTLPGTYVSKLTATSAIHSCKTSFDRVITIHPLPDVTFTPDKMAGCPPLSVQFKHKEETGTQYLWHFEDSPSLIELNPRYVFNKSGQAKVQLTATNLFGCKEEGKPIEISVYPKPTANFTLSKDEVCEFAMLEGLKNKSLGSIQFEWKWQDNIYTAFEPNLFAEKNKGDYDLTFLVKNNFGCKDSLIRKIKVNTQSFADFDIMSPMICLGNTPLINNKSNNANQFQWFLNTTLVSEQANPMINISDVGDFSITLVTAQNDKCKDTLTLLKNINVLPTPEADFDYRTNFIERTIGEVQFTNKSNFSTRYFWDFGDGITSKALSPIHEYSINRNIEVKLIAFADYLNGFYCSDTITKSIEPEWITTFHAPNALVPSANNPEIQVFKPVGIGLTAYEIQIYSPWGERVWYSNKLNLDTPEESWNGSKNNIGPTLPQGAYIWQAVVIFVNGKKEIFTGSVNILR